MNKNLHKKTRTDKFKTKKMVIVSCPNHPIDSSFIQRILYEDSLVEITVVDLYAALKAAKGNLEILNRFNNDLFKNVDKLSLDTNKIVRESLIMLENMKAFLEKLIATTRKKSTTSQTGSSSRGGYIESGNNSYDEQVLKNESIYSLRSFSERYETPRGSLNSYFETCSECSQCIIICEEPKTLMKKNEIRDGADQTLYDTPVQEEQIRINIAPEDAGVRDDASFFTACESSFITEGVLKKTEVMKTCSNCGHKQKNIWSEGAVPNPRSQDPKYLLDQLSNAPEGLVGGIVASILRKKEKGLYVPSDTNSETSRRLKYEIVGFCKEQEDLMARDGSISLSESTVQMICDICQVLSTAGPEELLQMSSQGSPEWKSAQSSFSDREPATCKESPTKNSQTDDKVNSKLKQVGSNAVSKIQGPQSDFTKCEQEIQEIIYWNCDEMPLEADNSVSIVSSEYKSAESLGATKRPKIPSIAEENLEDAISENETVYEEALSEACWCPPVRTKAKSSVVCLTDSIQNLEKGEKNMSALSIANELVSSWIGKLTDDIRTKLCSLKPNCKKQVTFAKEVFENLDSPVKTVDGALEFTVTANTPVGVFDVTVKQYKESRGRSANPQDSEPIPATPSILPEPFCRSIRKEKDTVSEESISQSDSEYKEAITDSDSDIEEFLEVHIQNRNTSENKTLVPSALEKGVSLKTALKTDRVPFFEVLQCQPKYPVQEILPKTKATPQSSRWEGRAYKMTRDGDTVTGTFDTQDGLDQNPKNNESESILLIQGSSSDLVIHIQVQYEEDEECEVDPMREICYNCKHSSGNQIKWEEIKSNKIQLSSESQTKVQGETESDDLLSYFSAINEIVAPIQMPEEIENEEERNRITFDEPIFNFDKAKVSKEDDDEEEVVVLEKGEEKEVVEDEKKKEKELTRKKELKEVVTDEKEKEKDDVTRKKELKEVVTDEKEKEKEVVTRKKELKEVVTDEKEKEKDDVTRKKGEKQVVEEEVSQGKTVTFVGELCETMVEKEIRLKLSEPEEEEAAAEEKVSTWASAVVVTEIYEGMHVSVHQVPNQLFDIYRIDPRIEIEVEPIPSEEYESTTYQLQVKTVELERALKLIHEIENNIVQVKLSDAVLILPHLESELRKHLHYKIKMIAKESSRETSIDSFFSTVRFWPSEEELEQKEVKCPEERLKNLLNMLTTLEEAVKSNEYSKEKIDDTHYDSSKIYHLLHALTQSIEDLEEDATLTNLVETLDIASRLDTAVREFDSIIKKQSWDYLKTKGEFQPTKPKSRRERKKRSSAWREINATAKEDFKNVRKKVFEIVREEALETEERMERNFDRIDRLERQNEEAMLFIETFLEKSLRRAEELERVKTELKILASALSEMHEMVKAKEKMETKQSKVEKLDNENLEKIRLKDHGMQTSTLDKKLLPPSKTEEEPKALDKEVLVRESVSKLLDALDNLKVRAKEKHEACKEVLNTVRLHRSSRILNSEKTSRSSFTAVNEESLVSTILEFKKIGESSLYISWSKPGGHLADSIIGYEIMVNGKLNQKVRNPQRLQAVLYSIDFTQSLKIQLYGLIENSPKTLLAIVTY